MTDTTSPETKAAKAELRSRINQAICNYVDGMNLDVAAKAAGVTFVQAYDALQTKSGRNLAHERSRSRKAAQAHD
jgi:hypothetical protein